MAGNALWNAVSKTDPAHTKRVNKGSYSFTAIDAYSQIQAATEQFGSVGDGWGWEVLEEGVHEGVWVVRIRLWWLHSGADDEDRRTYETYGAAFLKRRRFDDQGKGKEIPPKWDDEAAKKALTDAITKALSYLGFNSDVFLGLFDDSKYVEKRKAEVAGQARCTGLDPNDPIVPPKEARRPPESRPTGDGPAREGWAPLGLEARADAALEPLSERGVPSWFHISLTFGKHKGETWEHMIEGGQDGGRREYLDWLAQKDPYTSKDGTPNRWGEKNAIDCARAQACLIWASRNESLTETQGSLADIVADGLGGSSRNEYDDTPF